MVEPKKTKLEKKYHYDLLKGRLSISQLILLHIYGKKNKETTTIDELKDSIKLPRSTIIDHLKILENDGLISKSKERRTWELFKPNEKYAADEMEKSLNMLKEAYVHALGFIHHRRLKEVEELKKVTEKEKG